MSLSKGEIEATAQTASQFVDVDFSKNHMAAK